MNPDLIILRDSREKRGWEFTFCADVISSCLKTGDYTLQGYEDKFCIERKASSAEIAVNLKNKDRFIRLFERMSEYDKAYFICEFSLETLLEFPENSGIPKKMWYRYRNGRRFKYIKMNGQYMHSFLAQNCEKYGVELIFCQSREEAEDTAYNLMREYVTQFKK